MRLTLEDALTEPVSWQEEVVVPLEEFSRDDLLELSPIQTRGELRAIEGGYLLSGSFEYRQAMACTRCLEPAGEHVASTFEVLLVPREMGANAATEDGLEVELDADDLNIAVVRGKEIETTDFVLEQVVLLLPTKALCEANCAGLCPSCGENRNAAACRCEPESDPRWGALAGLRGQLGEQN